MNPRKRTAKKQMAVTSPYRWVGLLLLLLVPSGQIRSEGSAGVRPARQGSQRECRKLQLTGEVRAGEQWRAPIGEGWVFRVAPIAPGLGYTGWDLIVDREHGIGYPDALLLGTPPYGSLNEREIGTTYGLRAQDAIAWEPRRFHFFTTTHQLQRARELWRLVIANANRTKPETQAQNEAAAELMRMVSGAPGVASGQFAITDARLRTGIADPPAFAQQWVAHLGQVPHTVEQNGGQPSPRGQLRWIRFTVTLWLPARWKAVSGTGLEPATCAE